MSVSTILVIIFAGLSAIEALLYISPKLFGSRKFVSPLLVICLAVVTGMLLGSRFSFFGILFGLAGLYRVINLARTSENRMNNEYLLRVTNRSFWWLAALQTGFLVLHFMNLEWPSLEMILIMQSFLALGLFVTTLISIQKSKPPKTELHYAHRDLPTVTIAIPARNETDDLVACLESVLQSDYSKLEVLVLDDCSHTRISDIIKRFAHEGVRFIAGEPLRENWLPKNQAYDALADNANGELILFCGVDIRFEKQTVSKLVTMFLDKQLDMLCVLPHRPSYSPFAFIIQPLRYWWELAVPRFLMRQPPSLSSCWLINRKKLKLYGTFSAVSRRVRPETYFAREANKTKTYSFILNNVLLGVTNHKKPSEQFETAIRVRYPEMHKRPESVLMLTIFESLCLILPFLTLIYGFILQLPLIVTFSVVGIVLLVLSHLLILYVTNNPGTLMGLVNFPLIAIMELYLINLSMWRYEFGEVEWKGRNICLPVMHTTLKPEARK